MTLRKAALLIAILLLAGGLLTLVLPERRPARPAAKNLGLPALLATADPDEGARIFRRCAACHTIGDGAGDTDGPNLHGVLGRPIGRARKRFAYTHALQSVGGRWDFAMLDAWLKSPPTFAPGTTMAFPGLPDPRDRADVIAYLNTQGSNLPLPELACSKKPCTPAPSAAPSTR